MTIRNHSGSALPEYVVPLVLLAAASLIVLPTGGQLNSWFQSVLSQNTGGQIQNGNLIITAGSASLSSSASTDSQTGSLSSQPANGSGNNASPVSSNGSSSDLVEVTGVFGGSTTVYENVNDLETLAQQFEQSDPELYDWLMELKKQGKILGDEQSSYEQRTSESTQSQPENADTRDSERVNFETLYNKIVNSPDIYNSLTQDQKNTVATLSESILGSTDSYYVKTLLGSSEAPQILEMTKESVIEHYTP